MTKLIETFHLNYMGEYGTNAESLVICSDAIKIVLGIQFGDKLPEEIKVTASLKPFAKARSLWIHDGKYLSSRGAWTWKKSQNPDKVGETIHNGFYRAAINRLNKLISKTRWKKVSAKTPLRLYFRIEAVK